MNAKESIQNKKGERLEKRKRKKGDKTDEKRANKLGKGADKHETTKIQK